jgi:hypothetical protein
MRQFIFKHAHDAEFFAAPGNLIQRFNNVLHPRQLL